MALTLNVNFIFILVTFGLFSFVFSSDLISNINNATTSLILAEEPNKDCPVSCSNNRAGSPRRPVCGSDGRTYPSACHLRRAQCQHAQLSLKHKGKCRAADDRPCWADRKFLLSKKCTTPPESKFTPSCRNDGRYSPVQCFEIYCWCVDTLTGKPIPNTSVENAKPNCNRANRRRNGSAGGGGGGRRSRPAGGGGGGGGSNSGSKEGGKNGRNNNKHKRTCGRLDRTTFNKNMLDTFKMEYRRLPLSARSEEPTEILEEPKDAEMQRRVLEWKFSSLDTNNDQQLERHEYRGLRRLVRKVVPPRRCARTFTRTCDLNHDEKLSREEWTACLGVDFNIGLNPGGIDPPPHLLGEDLQPPATLGTPVLKETDRRIPTSDGGLISSYEDDTSSSVLNRGPAGGGTDEDAAEEHGCLSDRQTVLDEQNSSNLNMYIPECTSDGRYQKTQCYTSTGYCFCVDEDTGKVVPGSSVKNQDPKCDLIVLPLRPMKGCPEPKKQTFLKDLIDFLGKKMPITIPITTNTSDSQEDEVIRMPVISAEAVANWHFRSLDRNKDKALVRTEWKAFRALVESQPSLRQCGKKLPRYCDVNRDRKISLTEWLLCLGISGHNSSVRADFKPTSTTTLNPGRTGKNPLESILKPED